MIITCSSHGVQLDYNYFRSKAVGLPIHFPRTMKIPLLANVF